MTEQEQIEILAEEFYRQLNELRYWRSKDLKDISKLDIIISNLASCYNAFYTFFEEMSEEREIDELKIIKQYFVENKMTHEDELELKLRYGVEI